jgi:hypothetical protein
MPRRTLSGLHFDTRIRRKAKEKASMMLIYQNNSMMSSKSDIGKSAKPEYGRM